MKRVYENIDKMYPNKAHRDYLLMTLVLSLNGMSCSDQTMLFLLQLGSTGKMAIIKICKFSVEDYVFSLPEETFTKGYAKI